MIDPLDAIRVARQLRSRSESSAHDVITLLLNAIVHRAFSVDFLRRCDGRRAHRPCSAGHQWKGDDNREPHSTERRKRADALGHRDSTDPHNASQKRVYAMSTTSAAPSSGNAADNETPEKTSASTKSNANAGSNRLASDNSRTLSQLRGLTD